MSTDRNPTLWTATAALPRFEPLRGDIRTDVLVIGGGIAGLLCARLLTDAGADTLLVEKDRIASGVTARTTAKITAQHGLLYDKLLRRFGAEAAELYLRANEQAIADYRTMIAALKQKTTTFIRVPAAQSWKLNCAHWISSAIPLCLPKRCSCRLPWTAQYASGSRRSSGRWIFSPQSPAGCGSVSRLRYASWRG